MRKFWTYHLDRIEFAVKLGVGKYIHGQPPKSCFRAQKFGWQSHPAYWEDVPCSNHHSRMGRLVCIWYEDLARQSCALQTSRVLIILVLIKLRIRQVRSINLNIWFGWCQLVCVRRLTVSYWSAMDFEWLRRPLMLWLGLFFGGILDLQCWNSTFYCEPTTQWNPLKCGQHAPFIERNLLPTFSDFSYYF